MQFGGHVELNETPWGSIAHEVPEETGYRLDQLSLLQPKVSLRALTGAIMHPQPLCENTHSYPGGHFHTDRAYVFITNSAPADAVDEGESSQIGYFEQHELTLPELGVPQNVIEIAQFAFLMLQDSSHELVAPDTFSINDPEVANI
jgi:8-oxo-dGTP pyrophosphatase MutT (NUDIX family)